ncbi:phosphoribosyl-AMP cyclohydrolase [Isoalcanivorax beigongshangi]|uniref:Phosphoribosyl-AMP cyclohydrolase n=1 Tax=Isoalcanivorax beigongshangi TaxID=3238810 RepID=A0ABV4AE15_9GAMM
MSLLHQHEQDALGTRLPQQQVLAALRWNEDGLLPAIAQQYDTGEVLMMAWMNRTALEETLRGGVVCYWSRSRSALWRKGETSGQTQRLMELRLDCDGDTLLLKVDQTGPACHTGRRDCFYWKAEDGDFVLDREPVIDPALLYPK